ncbi:Shedu anti-phage system protein SduA domain-containing protein [Shewanella woodyi]|uniref:Shedu anti-phage system protein SduA domain-containing protein n=1 Tax=Shewanella woodyi TaxID=60961 RepID=UPI0015F2B75D|nr:Shedu anti-phage system protein SduA domain-containing protein [Shewanella woodyi]
MNLYERDYIEITDEERDIWSNINNGLYIDKESGIKLCGYSDYPEAVRNHVQLFPNNFLDPIDLSKKLIENKDKLSRFKQLFDSEDLKERDILNFIRDEKSYFIVGSILKRNFRFGHHGVYLFREFPLGTSFRSDFLIVGLNSEGYHFVFVEFESPFGSITKKNGNIGSSIRKGIEQIDDWDHWIDSNFSTLKEIFLKQKSNDKSLPDEFISLDKTRVNYVVVSGLRKNFSQTTYRQRRKLFDDQSILLLHYGNVIEGAKYALSVGGY